jgi:hypothetical protein
MNITISLSKEQVVELNKFMFYKKATGNFNPDIDPTDSLALKVIQEVARMEFHEKAKTQPLA